MTTGDPINTCGHCGQTYYVYNGHSCNDISKNSLQSMEVSMYKSWVDSNEKLDKLQLENLELRKELNILKKFRIKEDLFE